MPARRRSRTFAPALMAGAVLLLAAVPARAQDAHGAIAFAHIAQDLAVAYGLAWDYPSRDDAQEAAMNACLSGGGSDCTVLAWFQNGCGALAVDQYGMAQGKNARTLEQAETRAVRTCEAAGGVGCAVVGSECVSPDGQPDTWSGSESVLAPPEEESAPTAGTVDRDRPAADAPRDEGLTREERMRVQQGLAALGFDAGPADGLFGPRTRSAIGEWQQAKGLEPTGYLSREEAEVLAAAGAESREQPESRETEEPAGSRNEVLYFAAAGPKCAELGSNLGAGDGCWEEIPNQPGCFAWSTSYLRFRIEDWTGECAGDTAHGRGSLSYVPVVESDVSVAGTATGSLMHGKRNGHWVERDADGDVEEGSYVDGKRNGHWVTRWAGDIVSEGPYVNGEMHGYWVFRFPSGNAYEGPFVNGQRHGYFVFRYANGRASEGPYVDGKLHGRWVYRWPDGRFQEGPYVDNEKNGHWVERHADGDVEEGPYVDGEKHGRWVWRFASGGSLEFEYSYDSREGQSGIYQTSDGNRYPGRWSGDCFRDAEGRVRAWKGTKEDACGS